MQVALNHTTTYRYDRPVTLSPQVIRLRPVPHCRTPIVSYALSIRPTAHVLLWQQDAEGNALARAVFPVRTQELQIMVDCVADMTVINPFAFWLTTAATAYPFAYEPAQAQELAPYLMTHEAGPRLRAWLDGLHPLPQRTVDVVVQLNQRLHHDIAYIVRLEAGIQDCEETLAQGQGSCRDSAWLLVHILRHLGLAARFVSGYLIQLETEGRDSLGLHAWAEVYLPGAGWVGLDPTSGLLAGQGHLPLACVADAASAAPITGTVDPCNATFETTMSVTRLPAAAPVEPATPVFAPSGEQQ